MTSDISARLKATCTSPRVAFAAFIPGLAPVAASPITPPPPSTAPCSSPPHAMVKLATAREVRTYGPRTLRNRWEYTNAGLHVFSSALLSAGFSTQLLGGREAGLAVVLVALAVLALVNAHDLVAHLAGVDFRLGLIRYDLQLALVELAVPLLLTAASAVTFLGILFLLIQDEQGAAENMLIAGPLLWLVGSIHNACQIYERTDGVTQILQAGVSVPFLMGSLLFFVAGVFKSQAVSYGSKDRRQSLALGRIWCWLCTSASLLFLVGGLANVAKVYRMQQREEGLRLEKLRGGAQERLFRDREGRIPFLESRSADGDAASLRRTSTAGATAMMTAPPSSSRA
ncbi:hypothetical protein ZIOFF_051230 [Zingiber officinale]|uniref:Uncharacterized protein n=2 Tax=Zingiber officinale TaxID=94328 RepID=A0A8J5KUE1_ZINOF|nr:hypothetical protein ZIOFF_051230 [Zingiber officinale]